jgi:hypothetical protein
MLLRRDLQRLECLVRGVAVPSTPRLDRAWLRNETRCAVYKCAASAGVDLAVVETITATVAVKAAR